MMEDIASLTCVIIKISNTTMNADSQARPNSLAAVKLMDMLSQLI